MKNKLTIEKLKTFGNNEIFATGTGTYPEISKYEVRWVAVSGYKYYDWTIYALLSQQEDLEYIKNYGNKIFTEKIIKRLVPCTDEAYNLYRQ